MASIFTVDDPDVALFGEDLAFPFALTGTGDLATVSGQDNLVAALTDRAITRRGEIPHRPNYGVDFDEFQNAPAIEEEYVLLQARLLEQYLREDRLEAVTVDVVPDPSNSGDTQVYVRGTVRNGEGVAATIPLEGAR